MHTGWDDSTELAHRSLHRFHGGTFREKLTKLDLPKHDEIFLAHAIRVGRVA